MNACTRSLSLTDSTRLRLDIIDNTSASGLWAADVIQVHIILIDTTQINENIIVTMAKILVDSSAPG